MCGDIPPRPGPQHGQLYPKIGDLPDPRATNPETQPICQVRSVAGHKRPVVLDIVQREGPWQQGQGMVRRSPRDHLDRLNRPEGDLFHVPLRGMGGGPGPASGRCAA